MLYWMTYWSFWFFCLNRPTTKTEKRRIFCIFVFYVPCVVDLLSVSFRVSSPSFVSQSIRSLLVIVHSSTPPTSCLCCPRPYVFEFRVQSAVPLLVSSCVCTFIIYPFSVYTRCRDFRFIHGKEQDDKQNYSWVGLFSDQDQPCWRTQGKGRVLPICTFS